MPLVYSTSAFRSKFEEEITVFSLCVPLLMRSEARMIFEILGMCVYAWCCVYPCVWMCSCVSMYAFDCPRMRVHGEWIVLTGCYCLCCLMRLHTLILRESGLRCGWMDDVDGDLVMLGYCWCMHASTLQFEPPEIANRQTMKFFKISTILNKFKENVHHCKSRIPSVTHLNIGRVELKLLSGWGVYQHYPNSIINIIHPSTFINILQSN